MASKKLWKVYETGASYTEPLTEIEASSERSALDHTASFYGVARRRLYAVPVSGAKPLLQHATKRRDARVVRNGSGDFLDPPWYPTHTYSVETDLRRRPGNRGSMSLSYAAEEAPWLDEDTRKEARALLDKWKKDRPSLTSAKVQDWIHQVLGYFKGGYRNPAKEGATQWHASNLIFDQERDPVADADDHAGVHLIRKFYPDFVPSASDFDRAYWGQR